MGERCWSSSSLSAAEEQPSGWPSHPQPDQTGREVGDTLGASAPGVFLCSGTGRREIQPTAQYSDGAPAKNRAEDKSAVKRWRR